ncbi:MAG: hypothetical protein GQ574_21525 [Crocinitomix sp.]|nr:hypothetical protein [Crocinitomix sp.]
MQSLKWIGLFIIGGIFLQGCQAESDAIQLSDLGFQKDLEPLLAQNELSSQIFSVNTDQDTSIIGEKGTIINIPKDCFKTKNGETVAIELIEALTIQDMLLLNAQTVSDGRPLETGGIIYLNATANGKVLEADKPIEIKIPSSSVNSNMNAFVGEFNENGVMNWMEGNTMTFDTTSEYNDLITNGMFEIPFDHFPYRAKYYERDSIAKVYPMKNGVVQAPIPDYLIAPEMAQFYIKLIDIIESERYAGTNLATREFAERLYRLQYVDHTYHVEEPKPNGMLEMASDDFAKYEHSSLNIYINNLDKPLWYSDSLVYNNIKQYNPPHSDSDTYPPYVKRCNQQKEKFKTFYEERLTKVIIIDDKGVDLDGENALAELIQKGVKPVDAKNTISLYKQQEEIVNALKADEDAFIASLKRDEQLLKQQRAANQIKYYVITGTELGWINIDQLYDLPNAKEFDFEVTVNTPVDVDLDFLNVSMVFSERNSFISAYKNDAGKYQFTFGDFEMKTKLPLGERVTLVAISYIDDQPFLGTKEITLGNANEVSINPKIRALDKFKSMLNSINGTFETSTNF